MLIYIYNKSLRRIFKAAAISLYNTLNTRPGFYNISPYLSYSILNSYNIFHIYHSFMLSIFLFVFLSFSSLWIEIFLDKQT